MSLSHYLNGIGGTVHGSFFRVSDEVDTSKPPGATSIGGPQTVRETLVEILTGQAFFYSPNFSWFLLACAAWWLAPYQLEHTLSWQENLRERLLVNHILAFGYVGFWHVALYWWHWCTRPFCANRSYNYSYNWPKVCHNISYTWLGVLQWTVTEVAILHCYQTGRIPYFDNIFESRTTMIQTALASILLQSYRDVHFYFCHRMIHTSFMYKYIHSLHHRNTNIEPFSGLCMHPIEHMYYYTCYAPCLVLKLSPFILFWMGVHVVISPAASHSGYEDHFSADLAHYLHHRYSDCNYGAGIPFDRWFGSFRDKLKTSTTAAAKNNDAPSKDPKASLGLFPEHPVFNAAWIILGCAVWHVRDSMNFRLAAVLLSFGPAWIALVLSLGKRQSLMMPFDKDSGASRILHLILGILLGILPATYLLELLLLSPVEL
jgi:sterol desaturase/sphingolipid hydroxylase (fatty acid hydroxylase superfamily)